MEREKKILKFEKENLGRYFRRCLGGLSHHYTGMDTSRLTGIYFAILGLDLIDELETVDKQQVIDYIYAMQLSFPPVHNDNEATAAVDLRSQCGFIGSSYLGLEYSSSGVRYNGSCSCEGSIVQYMQSHIAMTYSAICALKALGDDLQRVDSEAIIAGFRSLQEPDGSFRSTKSPGECDTRFLYCACAVSSLLGNWSGVDCDRAVRYIRSCVTYEGGISLIPGAEAHGGSTYCALASLSIMGRLGSLSMEQSQGGDAQQVERLDDEELTKILNWCLKRQAPLGYNGRCNKECDSCYCFWIGGSIDLLSSLHLTDSSLTQTALLQHYQNPITGGFSKLPGIPVDIIHSFYSTAYLSLSSHEGTQAMNSAFCLRKDRWV